MSVILIRYRRVYQKYGKRGLRDISKGVLAGLTKFPRFILHTEWRFNFYEGKLYYQGYDIEDLVDGFIGRRSDLRNNIFTIVW